MAFMKRQIKKDRWYKIDTNNGIWFVPVDVVGEPENIEDSSLLKFTEGTEIYSWEIVEGYGARLSAPGYMDCTEWTVFYNKQEAINYLNEYYPEDKGEPQFDCTCSEFPKPHSRDHNDPLYPKEDEEEKNMDNPVPLLTTKIEELDPWFDSIKEKVAEGSASIHDVIDHEEEAWVIWSDKFGYSVSHRAYSGGYQGCSGVYNRLVDCMRYIYSEFRK